MPSKTIPLRKNPGCVPFSCTGSYAILYPYDISMYNTCTLYMCSYGFFDSDKTWTEHAVKLCPHGIQGKYWHRPSPNAMCVLGVYLVFKPHAYSRWCSSTNISRLPPELLGEPGPDGFLKAHQEVLASLKKNKEQDCNLILQSWALAQKTLTSGMDFRPPAYSIIGTDCALKRQMRV